MAVTCLLTHMPASSHLSGLPHTQPERRLGLGCCWCCGLEQVIITYHLYMSARQLACSTVHGQWNLGIDSGGEAAARKCQINSMEQGVAQLFDRRGYLPARMLTGASACKQVAEYGPLLYMTACSLLQPVCWPWVVHNPVSLPAYLDCISGLHT